MEAPLELRTAAEKREDVTITRRGYDDEDVVAVDFGPGVGASLDVVGGTAVLVAGDRQFEFDVPPEAGEVTTNDGILAIGERHEP